MFKKILSSIIIILSIFIAFESFTLKVEALEAPPEYVKTIGYKWKGMLNAQVVIVGTDGYIYVGEGTTPDQGSIEQFDTEGNFIKDWSGFDNTGTDEISGHNKVIGLAMDNTRNIYVVEDSKNIINKYDKDGNLLLSIGSTGTSTGEFQSPTTLALDSNENLYVVDTGNNRIQKFDSQGNYLATLGSLGSADGQFNSPQGIFIDSNDNIYIADTNNQRIQKFNPDFTFNLKLGSSGSGNGQFNAPRGVAVDLIGNIFVADSNNKRVQKFNPDGTFNLKFGSSGSGNGQFNNPSGIFIDSSDHIYVADGGPYSYSRIQKFDNNGGYLTQWGHFGSEVEQFKYPVRLNFDSNDNMYIADNANQRLQILDKEGNLIHIITGLNHITTGIPDSLGDIYISMTGYAIYKYSGQDYSVIRSYPGWGSITLDNNNNLYITKNTTNIIYKYAPDGTEITHWTIHSGGSITSMVVDDELGYFYLNENTGKTLQKYDLNGNYISSWNLAALDSQINYPYTLAIDKDHNIYFTNPSYGAAPDYFYVYKISKDGDLLTKWGGNGHYNNSNFSTPSGVSVDSKGQIYVVDYNNNRIQVYAYPPKSNPIITATPAIIACDTKLYTIHGYLKPKPGGLPACGSDETNPGQVIITYADGTVVNHNNNIDINIATSTKPTNLNNGDIYRFTKDLKLGITDPEVKLLQNYLNTHGYIIATTGSGSINNETNYFGNLTLQALIKYQKEHNIYPDVGYFGPITRKSFFR